MVNDQASDPNTTAQANTTERRNVRNYQERSTPYGVDISENDTQPLQARVPLASIYEEKSPPYRPLMPQQPPDLPGRIPVPGATVERSHGLRHPPPSPLQFAGFDQGSIPRHPHHSQMYPPTSGCGLHGTPAAPSGWYPAQQQQLPSGFSTFGATPAAQQLPHPSQTDTTIAMLAQMALAGDQVARGVMLQYWAQESTTGHGSPGFGSLPAANAQTTPRHRDITRIQMPGIRIDTAEHAQNSLYMFEARCQQMDIPTAGGDAQQDQLLDQLVSKWCEQVSVVLTSLRCTFPVGGSGAEKLQHIKEVFINPLVQQRDTDPESAVAAFRFDQLFGGTGLEFHSKLLVLQDLVARLPAAVRGSPSYWIDRCRTHAGPSLMFYFAEVLAGLTEADPTLPASVKQRWSAFSRVMAAAIDRSKRNLAPDPTTGLQAFPHSASGGDKQPLKQHPKGQGETCGDELCPSSVGGECDIYGEPSEKRLASLNNCPSRKRFVNRERERLGKPALQYPPLTNAQRTMQAGYDQRRAERQASEQATRQPRSNQHAAPVDPWLADFRELAEQFGLEGELTRSQ